MTDLMSAIKGRRSIRHYEEKVIPDEHLQEILEALRWSPSWANTQCWEVIVLKNPATKERLLESFIFKNPAKKAMTQAPVVLGLCGKLERSGFYKGQGQTKFGDWFMFDLGLATQTICLTAHAFGLGTVIVGSFDHNRAKEILGVGEGYELVVLIPLGYPAKYSSAPKRREVDEFVHYESF